MTSSPSDFLTNWMLKLQRATLKYVNARSRSLFEVSLIFLFIQATYPTRVRRALMELNRSVCIDMPESGVPWFHEKYCQEQMHTSMYKFKYLFETILSPKCMFFKCVFISTDFPTSTNFHEDIYQCLVHILGCDKLIKRWTYSPYYHLIGALFYLKVLCAV